MIECEEFSAFLTELVMVAAHVRPEETLAECEEEYELVLFQDYIEFQQYKLAMQAENLAKEMDRIEEIKQSLENMEEQNGNDQEN